MLAVRIRMAGTEKTRLRIIFSTNCNLGWRQHDFRILVSGSGKKMTVEEEWYGRSESDLHQRASSPLPLNMDMWRLIARNYIPSLLLLLRTHDEYIHTALLVNFSMDEAMSYTDKKLSFPTQCQISIQHTQYVSEMSKPVKAWIKLDSQREVYGGKNNNLLRSHPIHLFIFCCHTRNSAEVMIWYLVCHCVIVIRMHLGHLFGEKGPSSPNYKSL